MNKFIQNQGIEHMLLSIMFLMCLFFYSISAERLYQKSNYLKLNFQFTTDFHFTPPNLP